MTIQLQEQLKKDYIQLLIERLSGSAFRLNGVLRILKSNYKYDKLYFMVSDYKVEVTPTESAIYVSVISPSQFSVNRILDYKVSFEGVGQDQAAYYSVLKSKLQYTLDDLFTEVREAKENHDKFCNRVPN